MRAKLVNEEISFKEDSDPIKDMGIGLTLLEEVEKDGAPELDERMELVDDDEAYFSGKISHPMSGYNGSFEYIDINMSLTKENGEYVLTGRRERWAGSFPKYLQRKVDEDGEDYPEIDDWEDFNPHMDKDKGQTYDINEKFKTLVEACEYVNNELDFEG